MNKILIIEVTPSGEALKTHYRPFVSQGYSLYFLVAKSADVQMYQPNCRVPNEKTLAGFVEAATSWNQEVLFDAVVTFNEMAVSTCAAICEALNLPGLKSEAAKICRNKYLMRQAHKKFNVPHPRFELVDFLQDALDAAKKIGYPIIIKPTLGAGSEHIYRVNNDEEMQKRFPEALNGLKVHTFSNNEPAQFDRGPVGILVESYLNGHEHSLEAIIWDNEVILGAIGDRLSDEDVTFDRDIYAMPSRLSADQLDKIRQVVLAGAKSQGIERSVIHPEVRFHNGEPYLVEIGARAGGGPLSHMSRFAYDHCPILSTFEIGLGRRPNCKELAATGVATVAVALICEEGEITSLMVPKELEADQNILYFKTFATVGDTVRRPPNGNELLGQIAAKGKDVTEALSLAMGYSQKINVIVKDCPAIYEN